MPLKRNECLQALTNKEEDEEFVVSRENKQSILSVTQIVRTFKGTKDTSWACLLLSYTQTRLLFKVSGLKREYFSSVLNWIGMLRPLLRANECSVAF